MFNSSPPSVAYMSHESVNCVNIDSGNGLSPVRRQAITWTNAGLLSIGPLRTNSSKNFYSTSNIFIQEHALENVVCEMTAILFRGRWVTVYPKKYAHRFCFAVLCCGYTLTDFPISNRLTSLALWQSNDCPSASKATLMNMDKYFMWIHYEWLHNHNKTKHNKTVCIFLRIYCKLGWGWEFTFHCSIWS